MGMRKKLALLRIQLCRLHFRHIELSCMGLRKNGSIRLINDVLDILCIFHVSLCNIKFWKSYQQLFSHVHKIAHDSSEPALYLGIDSMYHRRHIPDRIWLHSLCRSYKPIWRHQYPKRSHTYDIHSLCSSSFSSHRLVIEYNGIIKLEPKKCWLQFLIKSINLLNV